MPTYTANDPSESSSAKHVPPGTYPVEIISAKEKTSQSGNEMIEITVRILPDGPDVRDFLVFTQAAFWKIDQVRAALGEAVIAGEKILITAERFIGRRGRANIGETPGTTNPNATFNTIESWVIPAPGATQDDIPF